MSDLTNYAENAIGNHLLRNIALASPTTVYLALLTAAADTEAGTVTEVAAAGYSRQACAFGAPSNGVFTNSAIEDFGPLSGAGTVTHAAIYDAASGGNPIAIKALTASKAWTDGDTIRFNAGEVSFTLQ